MHHSRDILKSCVTLTSHVSHKSAICLPDEASQKRGPLHQANVPEFMNEDFTDVSGLQSTMHFKRTPLYAQTVGCPEFVEELDKIELETDLNRAQREIDGSHCRSHLRGGGDEKL